MPPLFSRNVFLFLSLVIFSSTFSAQAQERMNAGIEVDVLPYITGGYFGAAWLGKDHVRGRALFARVNMPDFAIPEGFTNNTISAYALLGDYFLKSDQTGFWIGSGIVLWDGEIQTDKKIERTSYISYLVNGSIGYVVNIRSKFYLSPWAGMSIRVGGDNPITVDQKTYDPPLFNPELSLKFGYKLF